METKKMETTQTEPLFIVPIRDFIFKVLFGMKKFMASFLLAVLNLPQNEYEDLQYADPEQQPEYPGGKRNIVDLKLYTKSGKIINIEIQTNDTAEIKERMIYALCKSMSLQLRSGEKYKKLEKVIGIQITDFALLKGKDERNEFHNMYTFMNEKTHTVFSDIIEMHILELPKVPKDMTGDDMLVYWTLFLGAKNQEEMDMIAQLNPVIKDAAIELRKISANEKMQWLEKQYVENEWREQDMMNTAYNNGLNIGINEGELNVARKLKKKGYTIVEIMDITGFEQSVKEKL
jgi:predicted transposase/invertase (TIGR01784 family)